MRPMAANWSTAKLKNIYELSALPFSWFRWAFWSNKNCFPFPENRQGNLYKSTSQLCIARFHWNLLGWCIMGHVIKAEYDCMAGWATQVAVHLRLIVVNQQWAWPYHFNEMPWPSRCYTGTKLFCLATDIKKVWTICPRWLRSSANRSQIRHLSVASLTPFHARRPGFFGKDSV